MSQFAFLNSIPDYPVYFHVVQGGVLQAAICTGPLGKVCVPCQHGSWVFAQVTTGKIQHTSSRFFEQDRGTVRAQIQKVYDNPAFRLIKGPDPAADVLSLQNTTRNPVHFRIVRQMGSLAGDLLCPPGETIRVPSQRVFTIFARINGLTTSQLTTTDFPATVTASSSDTGYSLSLA